MTDEKTRALIAALREAHEDAGRIPQGTMVHDTQWRPFARLYNAAEALLDALEALTAPDGDEWCREESCEYRHWRSGSMPTHRRGGSCPEPSDNPQQSKEKA